MNTARTELLELLRGKKWTVGFAESCTGGRLSAFIAEQAGVSDVFLGSVVSYSNQVKSDLLGVQETTLKDFGAVSEQTAREMAQGARRGLKVETAVAITGIAGPTGGSDRKPVGMVCFAVAGPGFEQAKTVHFQGDRVAVQTQSANFALKFLTEALRGR